MASATDWLAWLLPFAAFANAAAYIAFAGNPLVSSDAWYFIGAFLQGAMEGGPNLLDFYVKRDGFDHAQPLNKLFLWLNAELLGLDFVFEALLGLVFAAGTFLVVAFSTRRVRQSGLPDWLAILALGAMAANLVTLNAGMVFDWSLVTLTYLPYLMAVAGAAAAWWSIVSSRHAAIGIAGLLIAFSLDDVGLIINAALALTCLIAAFRTGRWRAGAVAASLLVASEVAYAIFNQQVLATPSGHAAGGVSDHLLGLWARRGEALEMLRIVFGSTLAHINPLLHYFPGNAVMAQGVLAILALFGHAWFWWRAVRCEWNVAVFTATVLMLVFYGFVAGVIYARVTGNGVNYLHEPRYVVFYLLSNVALIIMLVGQPLRTASRLARASAAGAMAALLVLQIPLSKFTWHEGKYLSTYYHSMAAQMLSLGAGRVPPSCVPLLTICDMPPAQRQDAIGFLKRNDLNIYSNAFVERYRLQKLVSSEADSPGK